MSNILSEVFQIENINLKNGKKDVVNGVRIGKLISLKESGQIMVDYSDNPYGPLAARSTVPVAPSDAQRSLLLMFEKNDPRLPIITGFIQDQPVVTATSKELTLDKKKSRDLLVDGERITFEANKEIVLRCGKGSITVRKDGKIIIKGTNLLSRSKGMNKIKGAAVNIN